MFQKENLQKETIVEEYKLQNPEKDYIRFVCISDTHAKQKEVVLPEGDVLIHAGDFTQRSTPEEFYKFSKFLRKHKNFKYKILIAGNHERFLDYGSFNYYLNNFIDFPESKYEISPENLQKYFKQSDNVYYLQDASIEVFGYKIYGSPWIEKQNLKQGFSIFNTNQTLLDKWKLIPNDVDILVTHCPPKNIRDLTSRGYNVGCKALYDEVVERVKPKVHVFGHVHESHGQHFHKDVLFINAAQCNKQKQIAFQPISFDLPVKKSKQNQTENYQSLKQNNI